MTPEIRALVPVQERELEEINSDNFTAYLMHAGWLWTPRQSFAHHLDLSFFTPHLKRLAASIQMVGLYSAEQVERVQSIPRPKQPTHGQGVILKELDELLNRKVPAERIMEFYADKSDRRIKAGEIHFGNFWSAQGEIDAITRNETTFPLLQTHTHPMDSLPSAQDYWPLLTPLGKDLSGREIRVMSGIIVICPNIQILALAQHDTPILADEEALALVRFYDELEVEDRGEEKAKKEKLLEMEELSVKAIEIWLTAYLEEISKVTGTLGKENKSDEQIRFRLLQLRRQFLEKLEELTIERQNDARVAADEYASFINLAYTRRALAFARLINVKLYSSTNFIDFYEFLA